ncbi:MAG TPA: hypothetical protein VF829_03560 [Candidatus Paceibacterota bacterium]
MGSALYFLRLDSVRISHVQIYGDSQALSQVALDAMRGSYFGIIPKDSTFFYSGSDIRDAITAANPDIAAVSLFRSGLSGLSIRINDRAPIARWCGLAPTDVTATSSVSGAHGADEYCYVFDASGYIFAPYASSTMTINPAKLYAPLAGDRGATLDPLRATLVHADELPATFDLARQLGTLGSPVASIVLRDDEVDMYLKSGTRITYVLGNEQHAYAALMSARPDMNLADGSIEYVDLRFDGKVYLKKRESIK